MTKRPSPTYADGEVITYVYGSATLPGDPFNRTFRRPTLVSTNLGYVHGRGVDEPLLWYEGAGLAVRRVLRANHQGSIVSIADASGNGLFINSYDPYGVPGANNRGRFAYAGQISIPEIGMYYYKARIYSPTLGRFLQTDPIGYEDQINLYAYVGNDPVNGRDPSGRYQCPENQCKDVAKLIRIAKNALSSPELGTRIRSGDAQRALGALNSLGENDGRGVSIHFGPIQGGNLGVTSGTQDITLDGSHIRGTSNRLGVDKWSLGAGVIAHEATHYADNLRYERLGINPPQTGGHFRGLELNAWRAQGTVYGALGINLPNPWPVAGNPRYETNLIHAAEQNCREDLAIMRLSSTESCQ